MNGPQVTFRSLPPKGFPLGFPEVHISPALGGQFSSYGTASGETFGNLSGRESKLIGKSQKFPSPPPAKGGLTHLYVKILKDPWGSYCSIHLVCSKTRSSQSLPKYSKYSMDAFVPFRLLIVVS